MRPPGVAAIVPMRHSSERVPGKNYRDLGGRPLFHWMISSLLDCPEIDRVYIDTDSELIIEMTLEFFPSVAILRRPEHLRDGSISMNEVLTNSVAQLSEGTVLQTHSTSPFLSSSTISQALRLYATDEACDSVFAVSRLQARLWDADVRPLNHDPQVLLRTQDLAPIYLENSCFYVFDRSAFLKTENRIGSSPRILEVEGLEALDIDEEQDFALAEAIAAGRA